jgi:hypothetical protein
MSLNVIYKKYLLYSRFHDIFQINHERIFIGVIFADGSFTSDGSFTLSFSRKQYVRIDAERP